MSNQEKMGWWETDRDVKRVCAGMVIALIFGITVVTFSIDTTVEKPRADSPGAARTSEQKQAAATPSQQTRDAGTRAANGTEARDGKAEATTPKPGNTPASGSVVPQMSTGATSSTPPSTPPKTVAKERVNVTEDERNAMRWSALLWAGACFASGCFIGFIFGIPRSLSSDTARTSVPVRITNGGKAPNKGPGSNPKPPPAEHPDPHDLETPDPAMAKNDEEKRAAAAMAAGQTSPPNNTLASGNQRPVPQQINLSGRGPSTAVNTNLEQISDWLTKIIVGVSLVNSEKIGQTMMRAAMKMADPLGGGANRESLALAIMVYFSIVGLLSGYLVTRLFLQRAFDSAGFTDTNHS